MEDDADPWLNAPGSWIPLSDLLRTVERILGLAGKLLLQGGLDLPRFRGELRAWDQSSCWGVILSPVSWHSLVRPLAEPFFRPDPHDGAAVARGGGQGRPHFGAARRACP